MISQQVGEEIMGRFAECFFQPGPERRHRVLNGFQDVAAEFRHVFDKRGDLFEHEGHEVGADYSETEQTEQIE
jgi:hypothetical protein